MSYTLNTRILVGKLEGTPGTMETLTSADFDVRIRNPEFSPTIEIDDEASKYANGNHSEDEVITGAQSAQVTFSVRMGWGGTATTEPDYWKFLNACGLQKVVYGSAGIALQPLRAYDCKSITLWIYDIATCGASPAAVCYKIAGAMGTATIGCEGIGKPWMANMTFTGKLVDIVDVANADIPTLLGPDTTHPEKFLSTSATILGKTQQISKFQLDLGNEVSPLIDQSESTGYAAYQITKRAPRFSCDPLIKAVSTEDILGDMTSGLTGAITTGAISLVSNHFTLAVPKAQQIQMNLANREGLVNWDSNYKCLGNGYTGAYADAGITGGEVTFELRIGARS